jgi:hypothetical protein
MKLQEFVCETLKEVIAGVKEAQTYAASAGAKVNPEQDRPKGKTGYVIDSSVPVQEVDFDIAVTSADTTETQAGAGVFVAALGIGAQGKSDTSISSINRIRFSVPLALPVQGMK